MVDLLSGGKHPRTGGSALMVVLWVVGLLSILTVSFAFDAHIEARVTSYYRKRTKATYLATSGFEVARMLMSRSAEINPDADIDEEEAEDDPWYVDARRLSQGNTVHVERELGEGAIKLDIVSERARRNVNLLTEKHDPTGESWEGILEVGDVPEEMWPELVDSFRDWTDDDDLPRMDGAESEDYYEALDEPYTAKNGELYTVDELLLVKGFTRAILYGGVIEQESDDPIRISGIADLLTTFGEKAINVNAASRRVLMTLPYHDADLDLLVDDIIAEREGLLDDDDEQEADFFTASDLFVRIPELTALREYVTTASSKYYRITSVGEVHGVERKVWGIVKYEGNKMTILRWREED